MSTNTSWAGKATAAAMTVGMALAMNAAIGAPMVAIDGGMVVPSAKSLARFYPTQLSSTPTGIVEDQEVWMAKVQGLMAGAPSLLQQSLLMSQSRQEFSGNVALLQQMQKGLLDQNVVEMKGQAKAGKLGSKGLDANSPLGSGNGDLVYTALEPCRIMDSRNASGASGVQGPLVGNHLYHIPGFITAGTDWSQYGQTAPLSDCGLNSNIGGNIWGVAIVITILNPNFSAFLGVSDTNNLATTLQHVALNYTAGQGLSTMYIVPQTSNTIYFAMPAGLSAQIIFDVVGFFAVSDATALECNTQTNTGTINAGTFGFVNAVGCPSGFTRVAIGCETGPTAPAPQVVIAEVGYHGSGYCSYDNFSGSNLTTAVAVTSCCRVPGR